ncbi:hypothetical protein GCM10025857_01490 [Alicyclobacillus contaminans]|uniref:phosphotransferase family protein n=1 Tax=Alicyclobacillus contaminans TaxID=392016 RepID=UPI0003FC0411|nr:phosphotransferase [Alicyclobacillus contaminans]GMA48792.1 hypothetical protein GCM10025857_01490 [Alicyclobacillus contaminans]
MTTKIFFASNQIARATTEQLQRMLDRFHLGRLISSEKPNHGVMGQTLFVSSTGGEFVLKGNPLFEGQFIEEKFFVQNLHERTHVPVPTPYLVDESTDIFGWSYSLMPRLPGAHLHAPELQAKLSTADRMRIAESLAETLAEMHTWQTREFGEFDPRREVVRPFQSSYKVWLYRRIRYWLEDARKYSQISPKDVKWVEGILEKAEQAFENLTSSSFVMGDFKPDNFLLEHDADGWHVSGVFDFTTAYFGDPIADLPRMTATYLDSGEVDLAKRFLSVYLSHSTERDGFIERFTVHMLHQRVLDWGCAWAINQVTWDTHLSFSDWAKPFIDISAHV